MNFVKHLGIGLVATGAALAWAGSDTQKDLETKSAAAKALPYGLGALLVAIGVKVLG